MKELQLKDLQPYKTTPFSKLPIWIKVSIIKWWFAGAVYYFVGFGMPAIMNSQIDIIFNIGLVMGALTAIVVYPLVAYVCGKHEDTNKYKAIKNKSALRIIYLVGYNWVVVTAVAYSYHLINMIINGVMGHETSTVAFGAEPITFGLFYVLIDTVLIKIIYRRVSK